MNVMSTTSTLRCSLFIALAVLAAAANPGRCRAAELFHNGGFGECNGCHGKNIFITDTKFANSSTATKSSTVYVLRGGDPSSTCLICHTSPAGKIKPDSHYISTAKSDLTAGSLPSQLTPGGDFGWLKKTYRWSSQDDGSSNKDAISTGDHHGHSIVAPNFDYTMDDVNLTAPGGTYPGDKFTCISCHDPHGTYRRVKGGTIMNSGLPIAASGSYSDSPDPDATHAVGSYRLLAGAGYLPKMMPSELSFKFDPPAAVAPGIYNRTEETVDIRVAYGSGMSEWCNNCHGASHKGGGHPVGNAAKMSTQTIKNYNMFVATGHVPGAKDKAYSSLVPFEMGTSDYSVLKSTANSDGSNKNGPPGGANVMCLSCHRAHASGWDYMGRWNMRTTQLIYEDTYPGTDKKSPSTIAQGRESTDVQKAYYDRSASSFYNKQKGLCSKCHDKE